MDKDVTQNSIGQLGGGVGSMWQSSQFTKIEPGKKSGWTSVGMTAPQRGLDRNSNVMQSQNMKIIQESNQDQTKSLRSGMPMNRNKDNSEPFSSEKKMLDESPDLK